MMDKKSPLVAVLMCVYGGDRAGWLKEALDSLAEQTYPRERTRIYLGIDGPIGPELENVIAEYHDIFWKIERSSENISLPVMLNRLIGQLGEESYVFRMDSDDISEPKRFQEQINKMEEKSEIGVLGSAIMEFDLMADWSRLRLYPIHHEELKRKMHLGLPVAHPTVCIRRACLDLLVGYSEVSSISEDVEIWFRAMASGIKFSNLPQPLLRFRCDQFTLKRRNWKKARTELLLYLKGCYRLYGLSYKLIFPFFRYGLRVLPMHFIRYIYRSNLRHILLDGKPRKHAYGVQTTNRAATI